MRLLLLKCSQIRVCIFQHLLPSKPKIFSGNAPPTPSEALPMDPTRGIGGPWTPALKSVTRLTNLDPPLQIPSMYMYIYNNTEAFSEFASLQLVQFIKKSILKYFTLNVLIIRLGQNHFTHEAYPKNIQFRVTLFEA